jgi:hypothetical protein
VVVQTLFPRWRAAPNETLMEIELRILFEQIYGKPMEQVPAQGEKKK